MKPRRRTLLKRKNRKEEVDEDDDFDEEGCAEEEGDFFSDSESDEDVFWSNFPSTTSSDLFSSNDKSSLQSVEDEETEDFQNSHIPCKNTQRPRRTTVKAKNPMKSNTPIVQDEPLVNPPETLADTNNVDVQTAHSVNLTKESSDISLQSFSEVDTPSSNPEPSIIQTIEPTGDNPLPNSFIEQNVEENSNIFPTKSAVETPKFNTGPEIPSTPAITFTLPTPPPTRPVAPPRPGRTSDRIKSGTWNSRTVLQDEQRNHQNQKELQEHIQDKHISQALTQKRMVTLVLPEEKNELQKTIQEKIPVQTEVEPDNSHKWTATRRVSQSSNQVSQHKFRSISLYKNFPKQPLVETPHNQSDHSTTATEQSEKTSLTRYSGIVQDEKVAPKTKPNTKEVKTRFWSKANTPSPNTSPHRGDERASFLPFKFFSGDNRPSRVGLGIRTSTVETTSGLRTPTLPADSLPKYVDNSTAPVPSVVPAQTQDNVDALDTASQFDNTSIIDYDRKLENSEFENTTENLVSDNTLNLDNTIASISSSEEFSTVKLDSELNSDITDTSVRESEIISSENTVSDSNFTSPDPPTIDYTLVPSTASTTDHVPSSNNRPASAQPPLTESLSKPEFRPNPVPRTLSVHVKSKTKMTLPDDETLPNNLRRRNQVVNELINTERDYIHDLLILLQVFFEPLQLSKILKLKELNVIFCNIPLLLNVNKELLKNLQLGAAEPNGPRIGYAFIQMSAYLKMYSVYCNNHHDSLQMVTQCKQKYSNFKTFCQERLADPMCRNLPLNSFLIKPLQRICQYPLLLQELLRHTKQVDVDYKDLTVALNLIQGTVQVINESKRLQENQNKILEVQNRLSNGEKAGLLLPTRRYIAEAVFFELEESSKHGAENSHEVYLFLFNDALLVATRHQTSKFNTASSKKKKFLSSSPNEDEIPLFANAILPLDRLSARACEESIVSFEILYSSDKGELKKTIVTQSAEQRNYWVSEINKYITETNEALLLRGSHIERKSATFYGKKHVF